MLSPTRRDADGAELAAPLPSRVTSDATSTALMRRIVFGTVVALYVLTFPYHPGLRSPNELCRLHQTRALVEYGTIDINHAVRDFGMVGDLSKKDEKLYPSKAPLLSFVAVPLYWVLRLFGGGHLQAVPELRWCSGRGSFSRCCRRSGCWCW